MTVRRSAGLPGPPIQRMEMEKDVRGWSRIMQKSAGPPDYLGEYIQVRRSGGHKRGPEDFWCKSALYSNRVNHCGHSSKICGKKNNLPLILTKSQNPQTKNLKFKTAPGTLKDWYHHHWIPKPILAQNGFDSPPLDPNRGSRGRTSGAYQNT